MTRAFSLIEVMVVVALLGLLAALAAPDLLREVQKANLHAAADEIGTFLARAQNEAMVSRRCVRVVRTNAQTLVAQRFNTFDCDNDPQTAATIDGTTTRFLPFSELRLQTDRLEITFDGTGGSVVPDECGGTVDAPGAAGEDEIRFRPSGRVFSSDANLADDDGIMVVTHTGLTGTPNAQQILVNGHGLICVIPRGTSPAGTAPNFDCP